MTRRLGLMLLCGFTLLGSACATKRFVTEQVGTTETRLTEQVKSTESRLAGQVTATETKLSQRADSQDAQVREAADRARANREAIKAVGDQASGAKSAAESAEAVARDAEARLVQRIADRNKYRVLDTKVIHFDSGRADIKPQNISALDEVARGLKEDVNAVLEVTGFADPTGSERYNNQLTRDRADAVIRYLVQRHGIELRQLRAAAMGATTLNPGPKSTPDQRADARRVEMRLLAPWSSWEDRQTANEPDEPAVAASPATVIERSPAPATPATGPTMERNALPAAPAIGPGELLTKEPWRDIVDAIAPGNLGGRD